MAVGIPGVGAVGGLCARGAGMLSNTAVAANTTAATATSDVADRRMASAALSLPNDGRCRCQFHAPNANTAATKTRFTISATPYGVDQRFEMTCRCSHAMMTPKSTNTADAVSANGENEYTMSETSGPRCSRAKSLRRT